MLETVERVPHLLGKRKILVASDLSYRCDRALVRVVIIAQRWNGWAIAAHVLDPMSERALPSPAGLPSWRQPASPLSLAEAQLYRDLGDQWAKSTVVVVRGEPGREILRLAGEHSVDLIVTGVPRAHVGGFLSGSTVKSLLRGASAPILVVKAKPLRPYMNIVVALDFSDACVAALATASRLFPEARFTLFHAFRKAGPGTALIDEDVSQFRRLAELDVAEFLADRVPREAHRGRLVNVVAEYGDLPTLLDDYIRVKDVDLVVVGANARSMLMDLLVGGSDAWRLLDAASCDVLMVRAPEVR